MSDPAPHPVSVPSRRQFLNRSARSLGGGWLALHLPALASLQGCAREAAERGDPFTTLTAPEGATLRAFASRILPSGELPGAEDAGAAHFVDLVLGEVFSDMLGLVQGGLEELDRQAGPPGFAALSPPDQVLILEGMEGEPFFEATRFLVISGVFCDPSRGGNRGGTGWALMEMEHAPIFEPPFGFYDRDANGTGGSL